MAEDHRELSRRRVLGGLGAMALGSSAGSAASSGSGARGGDLARDAGRQTVTVASPNRELEMSFDVARGRVGSTPTWALRHRGVEVLQPGSLGLTLADGGLLGPGARLTGATRRHVDLRWRPPYGISSELNDAHNEVTLHFQDVARDIFFDIIARAYDHGVALRYRIRKVRASGKSTAFLALAGERTRLRFVPGTRFYASRDEGEYALTRARDLDPPAHPELTASCDAGPLADIPVTACLPSGLTVVVTESDRLRYPRLMLRCASDDPDALISHLMRYPGRASGYSGPGETHPQDTFAVPLPFATPWRVLIAGPRPSDVIERAGLVQTLATPNILGDTNWIRPGRAIRSFRDNTTSGGIACVDFAVRHKLEYIEFDAHWYGDGTDASDATVPIAGLDIERVVAHARERNVGVILYVDRVPAMRQLDDILRVYTRWGIKGIKFGFIWEGRQSDVEWIYDVVKKCGVAGLIVNLHDNLRPAGLERTLPNYLALEGVRGNEQFPSARHNVTLPFTRNVAGPIDYTICYAQDRNRTTNAHQLAMAVVYYSPLVFLYWYDLPAKYEGDWPELAFFDDCPTSWDETRALAGMIGEYVAVARRRGAVWFLGAMTNEAARDIDIPLSFLAPGRWRATIYADGVSAQPVSRTPVTISETEVLGGQSLRMLLAPCGGQAIRLARIGTSD